MKKKLVVAALLALIAMGSIYLYARTLQSEVVGGEKVSVLVAAREIGKLSRITKEDLAVREMPEGYMHPGSILKGERDKILKQQVSEHIAAGQQLLWSDFDVARSTTSEQLAASIPKGQRAVTIPVDISGSLAGMLRPSDHIDILGTFAKGQGADWATVTLLQNVVVLATGDLRAGRTDSEDPSLRGGPKTFSNITLAVDLEEAELLFFAMQRGPISVALRAQGDVETVEDVPDKNFGDIFEMKKRADFVHRHAAAKKIEQLKTQ